LAVQFADATVQGHDLLAEPRDVASGRQVDQVPQLAASTLDRATGLVLSPEPEGEHLRELLGLDERFELGCYAGIHGVVGLAPQRLAGVVTHGGALPAMW
jgi:hypothetical protein